MPIVKSEFSNIFYTGVVRFLQSFNILGWYQMRSLKEENIVIETSRLDETNKFRSPLCCYNDLSKLMVGLIEYMASTGYSQ
jgi:hypothetical protein